MKRIQQLVDVLKTSLSRQKFAGRNVEKGNSRHVFIEMDGSKKIIFTVFENIIIDGNTGCHQFGNPAFDNVFGHFRVFELLADGHPLPGPNQLGQIGIQRVIRKSGQFHGTGRPVGPACQGDPQYLSRFDGIFPKRFVKIAYTEQQNCVRMFIFYSIILFHQRRFHVFS